VLTNAARQALLADGEPGSFVTTVGITGHQRIPFEALGFVQKGIADAIQRFDHHLIGVSSLAAGADQLFAHTVLKAGGRLHIVVPCQDYEETFSDQSDLDCFFALLQKADIIETLDYSEPSEEAFLEAGRRVVNLSDLLIAVWDGEVAKGKGGTVDIVGYARERGRNVVILWPAGISR
jgi:predicted Rossmann fold nucleotide-binding protein DprA/Smf involved in DNA uptake